MSEQLEAPTTPEPSRVKKSHRKTWLTVGAVAILAVGYGIGNSDGGTTVVPAAAPAPTVTVTTPAEGILGPVKPTATVTVKVPGPTKTVTAQPKAPAKPAPKPKPAPPKKEPAQGPTAGQSNALDKAHDYLDYGAFSAKGLIDQLKYEGFGTADATWAVNQVDVNWKEQAVLKAKEYLDYDSFSRQGLIDQLLFEGFTSDQAAYGANGAGL